MVAIHCDEAVFAIAARNPVAILCLNGIVTITIADTITRIMRTSTAIDGVVIFGNNLIRIIIAPYMVAIVHLNGICAIRLVPARSCIADICICSRMSRNGAGDIAAIAAMNRVAVFANDAVVAPTAVDRGVVGSNRDKVTVVVAIHQPMIVIWNRNMIDTRTAINVIVAIRYLVDVIIVSFAVDMVVRTGNRDVVIAVSSMNRIVRSRNRDDISTAARNDTIAAAADREHISTITSVDRIVTARNCDMVSVIAGYDIVVITGNREVISTITSMDRIVMASAADSDIISITAGSNLIVITAINGDLIIAVACINRITGVVG